jgi:hypothetical protein
MSRKTLGLLCLLAGVALMCGGLMAAVSGFFAMRTSIEPVATVTSPGEVEVKIHEPGIYTLWHDQRYQKSGRWIDRGPYPGGFTFDLEAPAGRGANPAFDPIKPGSSQNITAESRVSFGLGSFDVQSAGTYILRISSPASEELQFSLTQGAFMAVLGGFIGKAIGFGIIAFLGLALTIGGVLMVLYRPKARPEKR